MSKSDFRSKHFIGQPIVRFKGQKAIAETNAMIIVDNVTLNLAASLTTGSTIFSRIAMAPGKFSGVRLSTIRAISPSQPEWWKSIATSLPSILTSTPRLRTS